MAGVAGLEPAHPWTKTMCLTNLATPQRRIVRFGIVLSLWLKSIAVCFYSPLNTSFSRMVAPWIGVL